MKYTKSLTVPRPNEFVSDINSASDHGVITFDVPKSSQYPAIAALACYPHYQRYIHLIRSTIAEINDDHQFAASLLLLLIVLLAALLRDIVLKPVRIIRNEQKKNGHNNQNHSEPPFIDETLTANDELVAGRLTPNPSYYMRPKRDATNCSDCENRKLKTPRQPHNTPAPRSAVRSCQLKLAESKTPIPALGAQGEDFSNSNCYRTHTNYVQDCLTKAAFQR